MSSNNSENIFELSDSINTSDETIESVNTGESQNETLVPPVKNVDFDSNDKFHFMQVDKYFRTINQNMMNKMISIIEGKSDVSLRFVEWFVTKYTKRNKVTYKLPDSNKERYNFSELFNVNTSYKSYLKT